MDGVFNLALIKDSQGNQIYRANGYPLVAWPAESIYNDGDGFDKKAEIYRQDIILPKGTSLCRYGSGIGFFTTFVGTSYSELGLPYIPDTIEYHEYVVVADGISVKCEVIKGIVAAAFNSQGGAIQFMHKQSINDEITNNKIKEVYEWRKHAKKSV